LDLVVTILPGEWMAEIRSAVETPFVIEFGETGTAPLADQQMFFDFAEARFRQLSFAVVSQVLVRYMVRHESRRPARSGLWNANYGPPVV
jgi:hypothetical protein